MSRKSRGKSKRKNNSRIGKRVEYDVRDDINRVMPEEKARRQPMSGAVEGLKGDVISKNMLVECKRRLSMDINKNFTLYTWLEKITAEAEGKRIPIVALKQFRGKTLAVVDWEWLLNILRRDLYEK